MQWTRTIWTIFKEGHIRIILSKYGQSPASSLGADVLWSHCWRRTTTHGARRTSNNHNSSPWANDSGELKTTTKGSFRNRENLQYKKTAETIWLSSLELMENVTIHTPLSTGLSSNLLSAGTRHSWRTRIWKNINTLLMQGEKLYQLQTETTKAVAISNWKKGRVCKGFKLTGL